MTKKRSSQTISVLDIAAYIQLNYPEIHPVPAWKMHKIAFFCQAYSLVRENIPFFSELITCTEKGIVIKELIPQHFNKLYVGGSSIGNLNHLSLKQVDLLDEVIADIGQKTSEELDKLIAEQSPNNGVKSSGNVDLDKMKAYYAKVI